MIADVSNGMHSNIHITATNRRYPNRLIQIKDTSSRILEHGKTRSERNRLLSEHTEGPMPPDDLVDKDEYIDILREAVSARNGWKRILERCSPKKPTA